jgi:hypothetical protein
LLGEIGHVAQLRGDRLKDNVRQLTVYQRGHAGDHDHACIRTREIRLSGLEGGQGVYLVLPEANSQFSFRTHERTKTGSV